MLNEELMPIAWDPYSTSIFVFQRRKKKKNRSNFCWKVVKVCVGSICEGIETFLLLKY